MKLTADIISGFSASLLQKNYDQAVESPQCHYEWWELAASEHPKVAIAAPRRHAKSTAITLAFVLASVCFRTDDYVLVVSDTITQAVQFLGDIKIELANNDKLRDLFKIVDFEKDTEDDVIINFADGHQARLTAKGSEQKLRGIKWKNKRPSLIVGDDMENDEIVLNKDRRAKFKRWFYGALIPVLAVNGRIRIVGTILHEDSMLNNLMPHPHGKFTVEQPLKLYSTDPRAGWKSVKYRAHNESLTEILWAARYPKEWFQRERDDFYQQGLPDVYSQEYLNEPIDQSVAFFKKEDFQELTKEEKKENVTYYITADLAVSQAETADYSVFVVAGVDSNKNIQIRNVLRERLDGREIVDTILALQKVYDPAGFGIEKMQISLAIGPFLREEMVKNDTYVSLVPLEHRNKDKLARARSIQARMRAKSVKFDKEADWWPTFEDELTKFPRGKKDDQADAFAYLGIMLDQIVQAPTPQELEEEEYLHELRTSGYADAGRSEYTGY